MQGSKSYDGLLKFLDFAADKGLVNKKTAVARKQACSTILGILDSNEKGDLSKIDVEDVITRHRTLAAGKIAPITLTSYESRCRSAVKDFTAYVANPSAWRPSPQRIRKVSTQRKIEQQTGAEKPPEETSETSRISFQPSVHIDLQVHISPQATPEQIDKIFESMRRHLI